MELIKVVNAKKVLESMADKEDIGAHLSYWMTRFVVKAQHEHDFYLSETRKLISKYAETDEDGSVRIPTDKIEEFNNAVEELGKTDVEAPNIKFALSEISSELKLSMKQMYSLLDFIDDNK